MSAVNRQTHNLKHSGSTPSSAIKHGVNFMIEIRILYSHTEKDNLETYLNDFLTKNIDLYRPVLKSCIDQNIILNCYLGDLINGRGQHDSSYFAINLENANLFIQATADVVRVCENNGFTVSFSTKEIDFDIMQNIVSPVLNDFDNSCWNMFPLGSSDPSPSISSPSISSPSSLAKKG